MNATRIRSARPLALSALVLALGCSDPVSAPSAEFAQPAVGTVFRYGEIVNVILETDGIRTRYRDQQGRVADRLGVFLTTNPGTPIQVDTAALMSLWPLTPGKTATVEIKNADEVYEYEFVVQRIEPVETGVGRFDAFVVQGVVTPKLVRNPALAQTVMNSWWYVPELKAVAQFRTTYLVGIGQGTVVGDRLEAIMDEETYRAWLEERGDTVAPADTTAAPGPGAD